MTQLTWNKSRRQLRQRRIIEIPIFCGRLRLKSKLLKSGGIDVKNQNKKWQHVVDLSLNFTAESKIDGLA
jgi:hypothetical protein